MANRTLSTNVRDARVTHLHDLLRLRGYELPDSEISGHVLGPATRQAVRQFQRAHGLRASGVVDERTERLLEDSGKPTPEPKIKDTAGETYTVAGAVWSQERGAIPGLRVALVDRNVGRDVELAESTTKDDGTYSVSVSVSPDSLTERLKTRPDLLVQVFAGDTFLAASDVRYNASAQETLDVTLPPGLIALPSEYDTLAASVKGVYDGHFADLRDTADRQDITYLANKTGWDPDAVALLALAEQCSHIPAPHTAHTGSTAARRQTRQAGNHAATLKPELYYALFRAGIPANVDALFQTSPSTVRLVWDQAIKQGIIPYTLEGELDDALRTFQTLSASQMLDAKPPVGISTLREMLQTSISDANQQRVFADIWVQYRHDPQTLWKSLQQSLGESTTRQLRLNGQLFHLTLNNVPIVRALHSAERHHPLTSPLDLASRGYHDAAKWTPLIDNSIPPEIPGNSTDERRRNYARALAAKVRLSFPTAVVADLVQRGTFPLSDPSVKPGTVADFLNTHQDRFAIGIEPVEAYIARAKVTGTPQAVTRQIKRLQRVYQLTRDDHTMAALLRHGVDSAYAISRYDADGFARAFQARLGGHANARAIHARAKQIHSSVLNVAVSYIGARRAPTLGGRSPVHMPFPAPSLEASSGVIAYPTLERLFGSLDYCNCPECQSILSPAAYLVDLLNYLDQLSPTPGFENPQSVLFERRPDLQYLALTCENTNTALPYVDIVNEILEYYVANKSLDNYRGHDTDDSVSSSELMASPQFVNDAAYDTLQRTFFPPPLPFNRPLELLRLHLRKLGATLSDVMATLRADDAIERKSQTSYGWRDILMEELSVSREEYRLFTDRSLKLQGLYGYPALSDDAVLQTLQTMSIQAFSRRTGVSYDDLFSIVKTQFVNPNAILLPRLQRLNVPFSTLQQLESGAISPEQFKALLPPDLDARKYGGNAPDDLDAVVRWATDQANFARIMSIVTVTDPNNGPLDCSGTTLQFRRSSPDPAAALLSVTDFVKLIRFIRLWHKLGLTISQTDDILSALYPPEDLPTGTNADADLALLDAGFQTLMPRVGFLFRTIKLLTLSPTVDLAPLLACWSTIGTAGENPLYRRMFLGPTVQELGPQTATIDGPVFTGDVFTTTINDIPVPAGGLTAQAGDTASSVASTIANAINGTTAIDPDSGLPLNARLSASTQGGVITIRAGFALACITNASASERYTAVAQSPLSHTATVGGVVTAGDVLVTQINGFPIAYTVAANDTLATIATNIVLAINDTTSPDPFSGLLLTTLVVASSEGPVITCDAVNAGAPFRLGCSLALVPNGTYAATPGTPESWTATINKGIATQVFEISMTTLINGVNVFVPDFPSNRTAAAIAADVEAAINNAQSPDPITGRPLNSVVQASVETASVRQAVIRITARDPATRFTLECSSDSGEDQNPVAYDAAGPFLPTQSAALAGVIRTGTVLITTIDGIAIPQTVVAGDTTQTIANNIATAINGTVTPDPDTELPLNQVVSASALGGVISVAPRGTFAFTLTCALLPAPLESYAPSRQLSPFADDGYGDVLQDQSQTLFGHEPTLRAAFNLTGGEFTQIANALGFTPRSILTLTNISAIFRVGWLAHTLRLSITEFLGLRQFTALDPFAPLDPSPTSPAEPAIVRFVRLLQALGASGLQPVQALYLMWNQDLSGKSAPAITEVTGLARTLRGDFGGVEAQFTVKDDPDGSTAKALMTLVYGAAATEFFFGLLNGTLTTSIPYPDPGNPSPQPAPQPMIDASGGRLTYDDLRKQLTFAGGLDTVTQSTIDAAITAAGGAPALHKALADLVGANQRAIGPFFAAYSELLPLYTAYATSTDPPQQRRTALLARFLPELKQKRKEEQALATITAVVGTDQSFAFRLLQDATVLHATAESTAAALADLTAIESQGLSVQFFLTNNPAGRPDQTLDAAADLKYGPGTNPLPVSQNGGPIAGSWSGYVDAPQDGFFDIFVEADAGATVSLQITDARIAMAPTDNTWSNQSPIAFKAGTLTRIVITATSIKDILSVTWATVGLGRGAIPPSALYSQTLTDNLNATYVRFLKAASLATALSLTANEIACLGTATSFRVDTTDSRDKVGAGDITFTPVSMRNIANAATLVVDTGAAQEVVGVTAITDTTFETDTANAHDGTAVPFPIVSQPFPDIGRGWLNFLSVTDTADLVAASLRDVLMELLDFARIKRALSPKDERLLSALENPVLGDGSPAIQSLTGWTRESLNALLQHFFGSTNLASLASVENLARTYDAFAIAKTCRITASALIAATTNAPSPANIGALQSTLRALYAEPDWNALMRPINDAMRTEQRDALVAAILQQFGDAFEASLITSDTIADAPTGTTSLRLTSSAGVETGMVVQGVSLSPGTTVTFVDGNSIGISPGTLADLPAGSALTFTTPNPIDTADKLFEYFLVDVETQPAVATSRIRLALSSVQLFIERILRNLEPSVSPTDIDGSLWPWMKRYRVWQANREVFLWPENWAYPELRDDQSSFFKEVMSALLQNDITDDAAAAAYLDYLTKLEAVAKLEPCGLSYVSLNDSNSISRVVARTAGTHRKHYFRQFEDGSWTPWMEVPVDSEDMPITPVVWNGRLMLFWLKVVKQTAPQMVSPNTDVGGNKTTANALVDMSLDNLQMFAMAGANTQAQGSMTAAAVLYWSEFYNGKWQPVKTSDVNRPTTLGTFDVAAFDPDRNLWRIVPVVNATGVSDNALILSIQSPPMISSLKYDLQGGFLLHNTHSLPVRFEDTALGPLPPASGERTRLLVPFQSYTGGPPQSSTFGIGFFRFTGTPDWTQLAFTEILGLSQTARYVEPAARFEAWDAPFFFEDRLNAFYVTTTLLPQTLGDHQGFGTFSDHSDQRRISFAPLTRPASRLPQPRGSTPPAMTMRPRL